MHATAYTAAGSPLADAPSHLRNIVQILPQIVHQAIFLASRSTKKGAPILNWHTMESCARRFHFGESGLIEFFPVRRFLFQLELALSPLNLLPTPHAQA
jgi:hypothetical protein